MLGIEGLMRLAYTPPPGEPGWGEDLVIENGATYDGVNYLLNSAFRGFAQFNWFVGLIDATNFSTVSPIDLLTSHPGWQEFQNIENGTRPQWTPADATSGRIETVSPTVINITRHGTITGALLCNVPNLAAAGTLYSTAVVQAAGGSKTVSAGGIISFTYGLRLTPRS